MKGRFKKSSALLLAFAILMSNFLGVFKTNIVLAQENEVGILKWLENPGEEISSIPKIDGSDLLKEDKAESNSEKLENTLENAKEIKESPKTQSQEVSPKRVQTYLSGSDISGNVVTNLTINPTEVNDGGKVTVRVEFAENSSHNIQSGDFIKVTWPRDSGGLSFSGYAKNIPLNIQDKNVGLAVVTEEGATITFNENVNNLDDVQGHASFEVNARNFTNTSKKDTKNGAISSGGKSVDVSVTKPESGTKSVFYYKTGNMDTSDTDHVNWWLNANMEKAYVSQDIRIEDEIQGGHELVQNSFEITVEGQASGNYRSITEFEARYSGASISWAGNTITVVIPQQWASLNHFSIYYKTKITDPNQKEFVNNSKAWYQEYNKDAVNGEESNMTVANVNASAGITGTVKGELKIFKRIEGTKKGLEGVKFLLKREDGSLIKENKTELELITNSEGIANIKGLPVGKYKVKEVEAPEWIDFDPLTAQELTFEVKEEDTEGKFLNVENKIAKTSVSVEKKWEGKVGDYVTVQLKAKGSEDVVEEYELKASENWEHTFIGLDKYTKDGTEIKYEISEKNIPNGYTASYEQDSKGNWIIKNTQDKIEVEVTKEWEGVTDNYPSIKLQLLKNGQSEGKPIELNNGETTYIWTDLDKTDAQGNDYNYTVKEVGENANSIKLDGKWFKVSYDGSMKDGFKITNKEEKPWTPMEPPTRDIKVVKNWELLGTEKPVDKIEVELYRDGKATDKKLTLNAENNWKAEFKDLDVVEKLDSEKAYEYSVKEVGEEKGKVVIGNNKYEVKYSGSMEDGFTITNEEEPIIPPTPLDPPKEDIKVKKIWQGKDGKEITAPVEKIEVELYRDGKSTGKKLELNKSNKWSGEFKDLDVVEKLDSKEAYKYSVKEVGEETGSIKLNGNWYKVNYSGSMKDGFTITNKEEPKTPPTSPTPSEPDTITIKVKKDWTLYGSKPVDKIMVELYRDGKATGKLLELNKANNWSGEFKDLDVKKGANSTHDYHYTIKEIGESGNTIKIDGRWFDVNYIGNMKDGFTIVNKEEKPTEPGKPEEPNKPNDPEEPNKPEIPKEPEKPNNPGTPVKPNNPKTPLPGKPLPKTGNGLNPSTYAWILLGLGNLSTFAGIQRKKRIRSRRKKNVK